MIKPVAFERPLRVPEKIKLETATPDFARAGEYGTWTFPFTLSDDVPADHRLLLHNQGGRNNKHGFEGLQTENADARGYVSARATPPDSGGLVPLEGESGSLVFAVPAGGLRSGEQIVVTLNGTASTTTLNSKFLLLIALPPGADARPPSLTQEVCEQIVGACVIHVIGGPTTGIVAHAPSQAVAGQPISILVRPEDEYGNVASDELGRLVVCADGKELPARRVPVAGSACCWLRPIFDS